MRPGPVVSTMLAATVLWGAWGCAEPVPPTVTPTAVDPAAGGGPAAASRPSGSPATPARRAPSVVSPEAPRRAVLPSGRTVSIRAVGTTPAGVLDVPDDIGVAGWWRGGSRIGDPFGSVLVAAHVDSMTQGLGPFAELLSVDAGARIEVRSRHLRQTFEVSSRRLVPQGALVDDSWIFDVTGEARLTLVTCAPPYDAARGGYQNLAVVTALPVGPP